MQELLVDPPAVESSPEPGRPSRRRRPDLVGLAVVAVIVAFAAQLPVLKTHLFYWYDDTSSVIVPGWRLIGEELLQGRLPLLDVDGWLGGNFAGEAQFGLFNPLTLANAVLVALLPDLAIAAILIKTEFLVVLATGVYLLAREYGAGRNAAAVAAVALPFSGYTLFWDAQAWITNLIAFSLTVHTWWTLRRFARGRLHPVVPLVVAGLTTTSGSPYGVLGVAVVVTAVIVERLLSRQLRAAVGVAVIGLAAGLMAAIVFLPLLGMQPVGTRQAGGIYNTGQLVPSLGHLLNLSAPTYVPRISTFNPASTPIAYLAWFVVPLLPWFAWPALKGMRARAGIFAVGIAYLVLTLAPSHLWMFRWPARLIEYLFLAVILVVALLLSAGLRTDNAARRGLGSAGLILLSTYLVWADRPDQARRAVEAALVVGVLVLAVVLAARHRTRLVTPALIAGTLMMLVLQLNWFPRNRDVTPWQFPHNVAQVRADFADRSEGNTLIVANSFYKVPNADKQPDKIWREVLFGNMSHVAGMDSLNGYTGMGNRDFGGALCMEYEGSVCDEAYQRVFAVDPGTGVPLADLLRLRTVTLLNNQIPGTLEPTPELLRAQPYAFDLKLAPPGWEIADRGTYTTVIRRTAALPHGEGRVAWTAPGLTVTGDRAERSTEEIRYTGGGRVVVAALAWPGWHASVDGRYLPVGRGPAGLVQVDLPERADEGTLKLWFVPAGLRTGVEVLAVGVLIGAAYCTYHTVRVRRRRAVPVG